MVYVSVEYSFNPKYAESYLAEFEYRINCRHSLSYLILHLAWGTLRTTPMPANNS